MTIPGTPIYRLGRPLELRDLDPKLSENGVLRFDCPNPRCEFGCHAIRIETGSGKPWAIEGEFPRVTVTPSINAGCWHGYITGGLVRDA